MKRTCENCKHFHPMDEGEITEGCCTRFPPTPVCIEDGVTSMFPPVNADDYCGEFAPDEVK